MRHPGKGEEPALRGLYVRQRLFHVGYIESPWIRGWKLLEQLVANILRFSSGSYEISPLGDEAELQQVSDLLAGCPGH